MHSSPENFYVITHEPGAENPAIPTWACRSSNPTRLAAEYAGMISRREIEAVPGAFQLLNLLSGEECDQLVRLTESLGYLEDAAVSLPRSVRHNHNITWIADDETTNIIWKRCQPLMRDPANIFSGKQALGLNSRFRFYRYNQGDYFSPHTDGSWPGTRVVDGELIGNAYHDRWSQLTFLVFLSDDYEGGATRFYLDRDKPLQPTTGTSDESVVDVRTPMGGVLCFPHGMHPLHCLHGSEAITSGSKYIIRSDVLFEL